MHRPSEREVQLQVRNRGWLVFGQCNLTALVRPSSESVCNWRFCSNVICHSCDYIFTDICASTISNYFGSRSVLLLSFFFCVTIPKNQLLFYRHVDQADSNVCYSSDKHTRTNRNQSFLLSFIVVRYRQRFAAVHQVAIPMPFSTCQPAAFDPPTSESNSGGRYCLRVYCCLKPWCVCTGSRCLRLA